jgi:hypothetical protein
MGGRTYKEIMKGVALRGCPCKVCILDCRPESKLGLSPGDMREL